MRKSSPQKPDQKSDDWGLITYLIDDLIDDFTALIIVIHIVGD